MPWLALVIPVPDQTPPGVIACKLKAASFSQKGPAGTNESLGVSITVIAMVSSSIQLPDPKV